MPENLVKCEGTKLAQGHGYRNFAVIVGILLILGASFASWIHARFGTMRIALGVFNGQMLVADVKAKSFGVLTPEQKVDVVYSVTNFGNRPIRLVGGHSSCVCTMPEDLPITIGPGEVKPFRVSVKAPKTPQKMAYPVTIYTTNPDQSELVLAVHGEVR